MAGAKKKKAKVKAKKKTTTAKKIVRKKLPEADFGVYFQITNASSHELRLVNYHSWNGSCTQIIPDVVNSPIPNDGRPHEIRFRDPCSSTGADGQFSAQARDSTKLYRWEGECPVWSSTNKATGPGIQSFNSGGHPLTVTIYINDDTPPSPPEKKKKK